MKQTTSEMLEMRAPVRPRRSLEQKIRRMVHRYRAAERRRQKKEAAHQRLLHRKDPCTAELGEVHRRHCASAMRPDRDQHTLTSIATGPSRWCVAPYCQSFGEANFIPQGDRLRPLRATRQRTR
jgi:hypothetical protein